jgi:hypothetical protein
MKINISSFQLMMRQPSSISVTQTREAPRFLNEHYNAYQVPTVCKVGILISPFSRKCDSKCEAYKLNFRSTKCMISYLPTCQLPYSRTSSFPLFCVIVYSHYGSPQAVEDRSQHKNRSSALSRLRTLIALKGQCDVLQVLHVLFSLLSKRKSNFVHTQIMML